MLNGTFQPKSSKIPYTDAITPPTPILVFPYPILEVSSLSHKILVWSNIFLSKWKKLTH